MKKLILMLCLFPCFSAYALQTVIDTHHIIDWTSKNTTDEITINNGSSTPIDIIITVNDTSPDATKKSPGVSVTNCGQTTHIDSGSSAICFSGDGSNPVKFSSDSPAEP